MVLMNCFSYKMEENPQLQLIRVRAILAPLVRRYKFLKKESRPTFEKPSQRKVREPGAKHIRQRRQLKLLKIRLTY